jgi:hypothetical protein
MKFDEDGPWSTLTDIGAFSGRFSPERELFPCFSVPAINHVEFLILHW